MSTQTFSKVSCIVSLYSKSNGELTFENFYQLAEISSAMSTKISSSSNLKAESPVSILYRTFWLQYRALLQEYRALLREYRALLREYRALLRIQWVQRSLTLQIWRQCRRSLSYTGLFCGNIGLFCGNIGLFYGNIGLFCGMSTNISSSPNSRAMSPVSFYLI